ncbi:hypothetical protein [Streptomyces longisporus]|uniref:Uncharacterized protein n=1 Tax=Streptomyces longisporus TaxID=1948 RepID=A0ABN3LSM6_STRLO
MRRNAAIWTAAVVSAALLTGLLMTGSVTAGVASAAPEPRVVAPNGDDSAPGTPARPLTLGAHQNEHVVVDGEQLPKGNSRGLGGTWNASPVLRTDPAPLTGPRAADGSLPSAPHFLVLRNGANIGARF